MSSYYSDRYGRRSPVVRIPWKVYGPDLNGRYGSLQGTGGLEATILDSGGTTQGVINDQFGNGVASVTGSTVSWFATRVGAYGTLPGTQAATLADITQLAAATTWRGRRIDPTGFYNLGARYYEPTSGRFLSADPIGQGASPSLYDFAGGDPVNSFDPDGRCPDGRYPNGLFKPSEVNINGGPRNSDPGVGGGNPDDPQNLAARSASLQAQRAILQARISIANLQAFKLGFVPANTPDVGASINDVADVSGAALGIADALFNGAGYTGNAIGALGAIAFVIPYGSAVSKAINQGINGSSASYVNALGEVVRQGAVFTGSTWVGAQMVKTPTPVTIIGGAVLIGGGIAIQGYEHYQDQQFAEQEAQANQTQHQTNVQNFQTGVRQLNQDIATYNNNVAAYNDSVAAGNTSPTNDY